MKIVVDTNVLIAAFLTAGPSQDVLDAVMERRACILSPHILEEFERPLLSRKFGFSEVMVDAFVRYLKEYSQIIPENDSIVIDFADPGDRKVLALCHTVKADFLITGDQALLALKHSGSTRIIPPSRFWSETEESG